MRTTLRLVLIFAVLGLSGTAQANYSPKYSDLHGARYNNTGVGSWDVGWSADIHGKRYVARGRNIGAMDVHAGENIELGRCRYPVYAATKIHLDVFDLETEASTMDFWLSFEDRPISERSTLTVDGKGHYRATLDMKAVCTRKRAHIMASCRKRMKFSGIRLTLAPEHLFPEGIQDVYVKSYHPRAKPGRLASRYPVKYVSGRLDSRLSDFHVQRISLPRLGVSVDIGICDSAVGDYRTRVLADNGSAVYESLRAKANSIRTIGPRDFCPTMVLFDSRDLDSDGDGFWTPGVLREIDTLGTGPGLDYTVIIPATWFDVPSLRKGDRPYKTLRLEYVSTGGRKAVTVPLRKDYLNPDGSVRIGFVHHSRYARRGTAGQVHRVYVVQSTRKDGIVIGMLDESRDYRCLQMVKGTLRVSQDGEAIQPGFGKKISYQQMAPFYDYTSNTSEFQIYHLAQVCNTLTCRPWRSWRYPPKLLWKDPYGRAQTAKHIERWQYIIDTCKKYGMDFLYETHATFVPDFTVHYPDCIAEKYNKEDGSFSQASYLHYGKVKRDCVDLVNSVSAKRLEECHREFFAHFKRLPYVEITEEGAKGRAQKDTIKIGEEVYRYGGNFYSRGALKSYRDTMGDPQARFPVAPGEKKTDRTFPTDDGAVWEKYKEWIIDARTEGDILSVARAAREAFKNNTTYNGLSYMEGAQAMYSQADLLDKMKIIRHPGLGMWVNEHGYYKTESHGITREYISAARQNGKKIIMLANSFGSLGPGDFPLSYKGGPSERARWKPAEAYWLCDKLVFGMFPDLDGFAWHAGAPEFWPAYQTVEWDRGLMPMSEARRIMDKVKKTYNDNKEGFQYDKEYTFKQVSIKKADASFDVFTADQKTLESIPSHSLEVPQNLYRGETSKEAFRATFRTVAAGKDRMCFFIEVSDADYTGLTTKKYTFPVGSEWPWKDKVDIYLGFQENPYMWIFGNGLGKRHKHVITRNTIWVEARCGEQEFGCYYSKRRKQKDKFACGKAEWKYWKDEGRWEGRIEINLAGIEEGLTVDKLTGFNLGIQDVDEDDENVSYLLCETYPRWVNHAARYADVQLVE